MRSLYLGYPKDSHWVNAWKLYLPESEEELAAWLNG
jgi:hypothetical protein